MAYDALINALLEEGRTKSENILRAARIEAERLLSDARQQCEILDSEADAAIRRDLGARRTAILSAAALSARRVLLKAKRELLDEVWRRAAQKAMAVTGKARAAVIRTLVAEVLAATSSSSPKLFIERRERPYLEDILKKSGIVFVDQHEDALLLGARVESNGEIRTNCFASRLAKAKPMLTIELSRLLFGDSPRQSPARQGLKASA